MRWEKIEKLDFLLTLIVFLTTLTVYILTLGVSIGFEDFAEFQTASYVMGVPHAPGYPLIVLWGKLFTYLPIGSIAYRVNLSNAFISSFACSILFIILRKFSIHKIISLSLAITFGFTATYWSQSVMVEVYSMAVLFFLLSFYFVQNWKHTQSLKDIYYFAFFSGLGITAHYINALNFLVLLFYILSKDRFHKVSLKNWCFALLFFFCGLLPFIYLPIASSYNPVINVGETHHFNNFINHLTRKNFKNMEFSHEVSLLDKLEFIKRYGIQVWKEFYIGVVLAFSGLIILWKKDKKFLLLSLLLLFVNSIFIIFTLHYPTKEHYFFNIRVYYFCGFIIFVIWIAVFFNFVIQKSRGYITHIVFSLILSYPCFLLSVNYQKNDRSEYHIAYNHAKDILSSLEKNAVLFTFITIQVEFPIAYLTAVDKIRPDVTIYSRSGMIYENVYGTNLDSPLYARREARKRIEWDLIRKGNRPIYYDEASTIVLPPGYKTIVKGLVYKVVPEKEYKLPDLKIWDTYRLLKKDVLENIENYDFLTKVIISRYLTNKGYAYHQHGKIEEAQKLYHQAIKISKENDAPFLNLCSIKFMQKQYLTAEALCKKALKFNKKNLEAYKTLTLIFLEKNEPDKAESWLERGLEIEPNYPDFYRLKGFLYLKRGSTIEALKYFKVYLTVEPNPDEKVKEIYESYKIFK